MSLGKVIIKGGVDHIVIPNVRTAIRQKFDAGPWTDLRVAFFVSVTAADDDDDPDGLAETISHVISPYDAYWIGLKSDGEAFPFDGASSFLGFTNAPAFQFPSPRIFRDSKLVSSDIGIGTSNAYYWRPTSSDLVPSDGGFSGFMALNYTGNQSSLTSGWEQHLVQDPANAGGYCGALGFRITRATPRSTILTVQVKANAAHSCDLAFSNTPTQDVLLAVLESSWAGSVRTSPQVNLQYVPDSFFFYWPFTLSRLRIHSRGFLRFR